ncbi:MAG: hypothetical protein ABIK07_26440, partial [Planctomycetota bacterium]
LDAIIVWKSEGILVDGHNRLDVWQNLTIEERQRIAPPQLKLVDFKSREAVHNWIITTQLGRRNLDAKQKAYLVGKWFQDEKKNKTENLKSGKKALNPPKRQSGASGKTSEKISQKTGQSPRQVERDAQFTEAVDSLVSNIGPEVKSEILNSKAISKQKVVELAELPADRQQAEYERAMGRGEPSGGDTFNPAEWGGLETVEEPVIPDDVVTEHHIKEMQAPFNEVQKRATALKKAIAELPNGPGGAWYNPNAMQDITTCYNNLMSTIKYRKPVAVCGHCGGKKCKQCYQTGALNKDRSEALKEGLIATGQAVGSA